MFAQSFIGRSLQVTLLLIASAAAVAQQAGPEPALSLSAKDAQLKWGGCPEFLPKGCALAVLHGDPAKPNADVLLKVPGKSTIPMHTHTSAERMVLVAGELHVTYEGQKMSVMKTGTYAYGPAQRPHKAYCASARPCILFIAFEAPVDAIPAADSGK